MHSALSLSSRSCCPSIPSSKSALGKRTKDSRSGPHPNPLTLTPTPHPSHFLPSSPLSCRNRYGVSGIAMRVFQGLRSSYHDHSSWNTPGAFLLSFFQSPFFSFQASSYSFPPGVVSVDSSHGSVYVPGPVGGRWGQAKIRGLEIRSYLYHKLGVLRCWL